MIYSDRPTVTYYSYTLEMYKKQVTDALDLPPPQRGASITQAKRLYKQDIIIGRLMGIAHEERLDITPTLANSLAKGIAGRGVKRELLIKLFGTPGRNASEKSADFGRLDDLIKKYRRAMERDLARAEQEMRKA